MKPKDRKIEDRQVYVDLTSEEMIDRARELAIVIEKVGEIELEKKEATEEFKRRLGTALSRRRTLVAAVKEGREIRAVKCEWQENIKQRKWELMRTDTGEIIDEVAMTQEEMQLSLPGVEKESPSQTKKRRGRPPKKAPVETIEEDFIDDLDDSDTEEEKPKKRRGRPPKKEKEAQEKPKKRGRGRPPKKVEAEIEEEIDETEEVDEAEEVAEEKPKKRRGRPKGSTKKKPAKVEPEPEPEEDDEFEDVEDDEVSDSDDDEVIEDDDEVSDDDYDLEDADDDDDIDDEEFEYLDDDEDDLEE